jgi:hypothetical protein
MKFHCGRSYLLDLSILNVRIGPFDSTPLLDVFTLLPSLRAACWPTEYYIGTSVEYLLVRELESTIRRLYETSSGMCLQLRPLSLISFLSRFWSMRQLGFPLDRGDQQSIHGNEHQTTPSPFSLIHGQLVESACIFLRSWTVPSRGAVLFGSNYLSIATRIEPCNVMCTDRVDWCAVNWPTFCSVQEL